MSIWSDNRRVLLAYSPGGHFAELQRALEGIDFRDAAHLTFRTDKPHALEQRVHYVCHPRRRLLRTLLNAIQSLFVLIRERPGLVISSGADVAVAIVVFAKLFGIKTVFIETGGSLQATLAGRLCYRFSDLFIVQWPERLKVFPKAQLASGLLL